MARERLRKLVFLRGGAHVLVACIQRQAQYAALAALHLAIACQLPCGATEFEASDEGGPGFADAGAIRCRGGAACCATTDRFGTAGCRRTTARWRPVADASYVATGRAGAAGCATAGRL